MSVEMLAILLPRVSILRIGRDRGDILFEFRERLNVLQSESPDTFAASGFGRPKIIVEFGRRV